MFCSVVIAFRWLWKAPMGSGQLSIIVFEMQLLLHFKYCWKTSILGNEEKSAYDYPEEDYSEKSAYD